MNKLRPNKEKLALEKIANEAFFLVDYFIDPTVVEISFNPNKTLFVERHTGKTEEEANFGEQNLKNFFASIASYNDTVINEDKPILSAIFSYMFEEEEIRMRIEAMIPPVVEYPSFSIRVFSKKVFSLDDYVENNIMTDKQKKCIQDAIKNKKNILVVGATSSGKTTLVNAIIKEMSILCPYDRILVLEDTGEINSSHRNSLRMLTSDNITMQRLVKSTLRLSPDRIIVGELRGAETLDLIEAWNTGHPGGVATIHADSSVASFSRVEQLILQGSTSVPKVAISQAINIVINIQKVGKARKVLDITSCEGLKNNEYVFKTK